MLSWTIVLNQSFNVFMTGVIWLLLLTTVLCADMNSTTQAIPVLTKIPTFTGLSFFGGLVIMVLFVLVPVGMMAYRNRNSIVEFIKNR